MNVLTPSPWADLVTSMRRRRSHDARFFKPVCLTSVIDLIDEGKLDPENIDPAQVIERFRFLVANHQPKRAALGWRPLWHLSNDGAWVFTKSGKPVRPEDFGVARKPDSVGQFYARFDHIAVPVPMLEQWRSARARASLRQATLAMLAADDADCRQFALALGRMSPDPEPAAPPALIRPSGGGQGFASDPALRLAVERHSMAMARAWLEAEGWTVSDHSSTQPYDYLAQRQAESLYVEVKGTTTAGDAINITYREVEFARANRANMALIVISGIMIETHTNETCAAGGHLAVRLQWAPDPADLRPIAFICTLGEEK